MKHRVLLIGLCLTSLLGACSQTGVGLSATEGAQVAKNLADLRTFRNQDIEALRSTFKAYIANVSNDTSRAPYLTLLNPSAAVALQIDEQPVVGIITAVQGNPGSDLLLGQNDPGRAPLLAYAQQFLNAAAPALAAETQITDPTHVQTLNAAVAAARDLTTLLQTTPQQATQLSQMGCLAPTDPGAVGPLLAPDAQLPPGQGGAAPLGLGQTAPGQPGVVVQPMNFGGGAGVKGPSKGVPPPTSKGMPYSPPSLQTGYQRSGKCAVLTALFSRKSGQYVASAQQCPKAGCFIKRFFTRMNSKGASPRGKGVPSRQNYGKGYPSAQNYGKAYPLPPSKQAPVVYPSGQTASPQAPFPSTQMAPVGPGPAGLPGMPVNPPTSPTSALAVPMAPSDAAPPAPLAPSGS